MKVQGQKRVAGWCLATTIAVLLSTAANAQYKRTDLVSNQAGVTAVTDPHLINGWGLTRSPSSPFWVSDNGTGKSTLYTGSGAIVPLVVTIPPAPAIPLACQLERFLTLRWRIRRPRLRCQKMV